jgi:raffinose/stachyose/melibiose transport system substrate-binding protein
MVFYKIKVKYYLWRKENMKKMLVVLLALTMVGTVFAGGSKDSKAGGDGKIVIELMSMHSNPTLDANSVAFYAQLEKFRKDFPNVTVNLQTSAHDDYETLLKTYLAGGQYPDIYQAKGTVLPQLADDGAIVSSKEIMKLVPGLESGFKGGVFEDFTYKNDYWAIPMQMGNNHNIFWNSAIFAECGITEFPKDLASFQDAVIKIKAKGYVPMVLGNKANWLVPSLFLNTVVYRFTGIDWYYSVREGKGAKFTDPSFVAASKLVQDMYKNGTFNTDINSIDEQQMKTVYYNKKAAMMTDGFWAVGSLDVECPKDVLAVTKIAQFPAVPESAGGGGAKYAKINQAAAGWGWVVTKRSKETPAKLQAMANLVSYLTGKDYATIVVANSGLPASNPASIDNTKLTPLYQQLLALNNESTYAPVFDVQLDPQVVDAFYSNTQRLLIGEITPQEYGRLIQVEVDKTRR